MFLASAIVFVNVIMIQSLQMPTAEGLFINRQFSETDILETPQRSIRTIVSKCPTCDCRINTRKKRIVGGIEAEQNEFPWMAALSDLFRLHCGATLITKQHLLTAAHCVDEITATGIKLGRIKALLGENIQELTYGISNKTVRIKEIILHPGYDREDPNSDNDIAILKLDRTISFNTPQIQPACLPSSENQDYAGYIGTVIGWGHTKERGQRSKMLRKVKVPIVPTKYCRINYSYLSYSVTDNMMCAGYYYSGGRNSCHGDSGGPLQINRDGLGTMEVVGIVSWSNGCGRPYYPGVYTRIDRYIGWIRDNIGEECLCEI
ncbi:trypsin-1-like [Planococcus citri]|uniref:trypsin-1-like n=1 Tax=Planococcus citri TaxID=170843 RepID=UPI0031F8C585